MIDLHISGVDLFVRILEIT